MANNNNVKLAIKVDGTRPAINACDGINRRLEKMVVNAQKVSQALTASFRSANVAAQALSANFNKAATLEAKKISAAKATTNKLQQEYKKRADAEWKELERAAKKYEKEEQRRVAAEKRATDRANKAKSKKGGSWGSVGGIGAGVAAGATSWGLGLATQGVSATGAFVADQARTNMALDDRMKRLSIQGRGTGESGMMTSEIRSKVFEQANRGKDSGEVLAGLEAVVSRTGDMKLAMNSLEAMTDISLATNASMEDLGGVVSDLATKFELTKPEELKEALSMLAIQGKRGAFELKDMAEGLPEIAAAAKGYGMTGMQGLRTVGAIAQVSRGAKGTSAEATTAARALFTDLMKNSDKVKKLTAGNGKAGIDVMDKNHQGKDLLTLLPQIIAGIKGDPKKLFDILGDRSAPAQLNLLGEYNKTFKASKDSGDSDVVATKKATDALTASLQKAADVSDAKSEIDRDIISATGSVTTRMQAAQSQMTEAMGNIDWKPLIDALPAFVKATVYLAESLAQLVDFIDRITGNAGKNKVKRAQADIDANTTAQGVLGSKKIDAYRNGEAIQNKLKNPKLTKKEREALEEEMRKNEAKIETIKEEEKKKRGEEYTNKSALEMAINNQKNEAQANTVVGAVAKNVANVMTGGGYDAVKLIISALGPDKIETSSGNLAKAIQSKADAINGITIVVDGGTF